MPSPSLADNVARVREALVDACARAQRDPAEITLIAVSKQKPTSAILEAVAAGLQHFGESRVEEAQEKIAQVRGASGQPMTWHMIGHIQSRKARQVPPLFDVVHSVDSLRLAQRLAEAAAARPEGRPLPVLVQVNISGEAAKSGLPALGWEHEAAVREALSAEISAIAAQPGLDVRGLMTIAPLAPDPEQARPFFA
ncbi:YggS family pyridoxal phosphate-dependent enzyme, partial [bacterium]|nr:YggS family pyridoxal phosphate-dependent enzyme [bacterium]